MSTSLTGNDVIQINSRILNDLADGDAVAISFPNDMAAVKAGKNGNVLFSENKMGNVADITIRILLGSSDDKFLNSLMQDQKNDFSAVTLLTGYFTKRTSDGQGNMSSVVYECSGGIFKKMVEAKTSAEGDTEQSVATYAIQFGQSNKSIQ